MQMKVNFDDAALRRALNGLEADMAKVQSQAINETLLDVQRDEIAYANKSFKITKPSFLKRSVKITQFSKPETLTGVIAIADMGASKTSDIFSKFSEVGTGTKRPKSGGNLTIPTGDLKRTKSGGIPKNQRPRALTKAFKLEDGGKTFLAVNKGSKKNRTISLLYVFRPSARLRMQFPFESVAQKTVNRVALNHLNEAVRRAIVKRGLTT